MGNLNKVFLIGRLGAKPEKRFSRNNTAVTTMNIATSEYYTDKSGEKKERTEWHRVVMWDRLAELADQYLDKGREVFIEGRLQTREWMDKDNNKRYTTEIVGTAMQFIGGNSASAGSQGYNQPSYGEPRRGFGAQPTPFGNQPSPFANQGGGNRQERSHSVPPGSPGLPPPPGDPNDVPFIEDDVPF